LQEKITSLKEQQEQATADGDEVKAKELANEIKELENSLEALNSANTALMETTTEAPVSEESSGGGSGSVGMIAGIVVALLIVIVLIGAVLMKRRNDAGKVDDESRKQPGFENPTYEGQEDNNITGGDMIVNSSAEQPEYATTDSPNYEMANQSPVPGEVVSEQADDGEATAVFNMMSADESDYARGDEFDNVANAITANSGSGDVFEVSSPDQSQDKNDLPEQSYDLPEPEMEGRGDDAKNTESAEALAPTSVSGEQSFEGFGDDLYGESMDFDDVIASAGLELDGMDDGFVEL
jgi:hypothetical protein